MPASEIARDSVRFLSMFLTARPRSI